MAYSPIELREMSEHLLDHARLVAPEAEGFDPDEDFTMEELVQLRTFLSATRKAVDLVNSGLARYWDEHFSGEEFEDEYLIWYVGHVKRRRAVDGDMLIEWVASLDAERLAKVFNPNRLTEVLRVTGMSPAERDTLLIEEYSQTSGISINNKEKR